MTEAGQGLEDGTEGRFENEWDLAIDGKWWQWVGASSFLKPDRSGGANWNQMGVQGQDPWIT